MLYACALALSVCILQSCGAELREGTSDTRGVRVGFAAGGSVTRTVMNPDGLSSSWEPGDRISLWARNSSGSYILAGRQFALYGSDDSHAFFSTTLSEAMPSGTYTYYAAYPAPVSLNGSNLSFDLP